MSRRHLAVAGAWPTPALLAASMAPEAAASSNTQLSAAATYTYQNKCIDGVKAAGSLTYVVPVGAQITSISVSLWIPVRSLDLVSATTAWTTPVLTGATRTFGTSTTYFEYRATHAALTTTASPAVLPFSFQDTKVTGSGCPDDPHFAIDSSSVVSGSTQVTQSGLLSAAAA
jgi:hypothetical protein